MGHAESQVMSVQLTMTPELATELQREQGALAVARAYIIDSPEMAIEANKELKLVKARITRLKELKSGFVAPAKQIIANAEALFDPAIDANLLAETFLKGQLTDFDAKQRQLADEARRAREAEERRARQEAEAKAAAERARAEEQAKEARRQAEEAEAARRKAESDGNARAAAAAAAEAAKALARAHAATENGEAKAQQMELAASAMPSSVVEHEAVKLEGFSTRENWVAELVDGFDEDRVKREVCAAIGTGRSDLLALVKLDLPAANRLAKALKRSMNVPGLKAVNRPVAASRV